MKKLICRVASLALIAAAQLGTLARPAFAETPDAAAARAEIEKTFGFVPSFVAAIPDEALPGAWRELAGLQLSETTALPGKIKELIGLGVSAQIPCRYCIYGHTEFAKVDGASQREIGEAVAMAALTRHWSTIFQGALLDEAAYRRDIGKLVAAARHAGPSPAPAPHASDADGALAEMRQNFGFVPGFIAAVPREALPGAWQELMQVELSPATQLSAKDKSLIGLAVASQIPCRYCVIGDTEFAKLAGASEREIHEAVAMAALARNWSTLFNGLQIDEAAYRRDIDRLVKGAQHATPQALAGKGAH
ncbi:MAG TPA: carboxymuconolactone decarboxylase family protein [Polyangiaceae bacterium]|nr:carboxymuconolactone decarboxylase family protein [Polyangiaceae bacterium]